MLTLVTNKQTFSLNSDILYKSKIKKWDYKIGVILFN